MYLRPASFFSALLLLVALLAPNLTFAEEDGKVKVGIVFENDGFRNLDLQYSLYGNHGGVVLGYEKSYNDFWWAVDGKYKYGRVYYMNYGIDLASVHGQGVVGKSYNMSGISLKPYMGLGLNWEAQDGRGTSNIYTTEYLLVFGTRAERKVDAGIVGLDLQYDYVLSRDIYDTANDNSWGRRHFDGSYGIEAGVYYEPANIPVGFRPYFKYEKWQTTKYWYSSERQRIGIETYVKF